MNFGTTFYLSRVIGNTIYLRDGSPVGKLRDIVVDVNSVRPRAVAVRMKQRNRVITSDISSFSIAKVNAQYRIETDEIKEVEDSKDWLGLVERVLDKQIVDMFGRKVVRVNDLRLAALSTGTYVVAFDVGFEGFLRRLGVAKPLKRVLKPLHITISSNLLLWEEVETIEASNRGIRLANTYSKLSRMHPSDLADILEDLDRKTQLDIFSSLDVDTAAEVLEELEPDAQVTVVESLTTNQAVDMLGRLSADEVADILDELRDEKADAILNAMDTESRSEIEDLMGYDEDTVGSMMTTDMVTASQERRVSETLEWIRREQPESDVANYVFVVDAKDRMKGYVSLRDLVVASPDTPIEDIMETDFVTVQDKEDVEEAVAKMTKYNLTILPVVDEDDVLVGAVLLVDVVNELWKQRRRR